MSGRRDWRPAPRIGCCPRPWRAARCAGSGLAGRDELVGASVQQDEGRAGRGDVGGRVRGRHRCGVVLDRQRGAGAEDELGEGVARGVVGFLNRGVVVSPQYQSDIEYPVNRSTRSLWTGRSAQVQWSGQVMASRACVQPRRVAALNRVRPAWTTRWGKRSASLGRDQSPRGCPAFLLVGGH